MNTNQDSVSHRDEAKSPCQSQETGKASSRSEWIRQNSIDVQPAEQGKKHAAHRLDNAQATNCSAGRIQSGLIGAQSQETGNPTGLNVEDTVRHSGYVIQRARDYWLSCGREPMKSGAKDELEKKTNARGTVTDIFKGAHAWIVQTHWNDGSVSKSLSYLLEKVETSRALEVDIVSSGRNYYVSVRGNVYTLRCFGRRSDAKEYAEHLMLGINHQTRFLKEYGWIPATEFRLSPQDGKGLSDAGENKKQ